MPRTHRRDLIQNILIALLSVSAVALFVRTQLLSRQTGGYLTTLLSSASAEETNHPARLTELAQPIRFAVTGAYGRWGDAALTTVGEGFSAPGALLREALGSAAVPTACTERDFRTALGSLSAYYDFRTVLPLSVIGGLTGAEDGVPAGSARRLVLAVEDETVCLYWTDGNSFSRSVTRVAPGDLTSLVNSYQLGSASFAYELEDAAALEPYTLLLTGEQRTYPNLSADAAAGSDFAMLSALGFNPRTNSRYTEKGGAEVVMDGERTVRLTADGGVRYESGGVLTEQIAAGDGQTPTAQETVTGACRLLNALLGGRGGDAALYLSAAARSGGTWTLTFEYQVGGVPVLRTSGVHGAQVVLEGAGIVSLELNARRYTSTGEASLLLPLPQALAVAAGYPGCEPAVCYSDGGVTPVSAAWLAG